MLSSSSCYKPSFNTCAIRIIDTDRMTVSTYVHNIIQKNRRGGGNKRYWDVDSLARYTGVLLLSFFSYLFFFSRFFFVFSVSSSFSLLLVVDDLLLLSLLNSLTLLIRLPQVRVASMASASDLAQIEEAFILFCKKGSDTLTYSDCKTVSIPTFQTRLEFPRPCHPTSYYNVQTFAHFNVKLWCRPSEALQRLGASPAIRN